MRVIIKVVLTIVLLMIGTVIVEGIKSSMGTKHSSGGIGPLIVYPALIAGIYAIWKNRSVKEDNSSADNETLRKD